MKQREEARQKYENDLQSTQTLKDGTNILPDSFNTEYEKMYQEVTQKRPDINSLMKSYEDGIKEIVEHEQRQEASCRQMFATLQSSTWSLISQTLSGINTYHDSENNYIWQIDEKKIRNGAWKPEQNEYNRIVNERFGSRRRHFIYLQQPNGYMFELV